MKAGMFSAARFLLIWGITSTCLLAQGVPEFTGIRLLSGAEVGLSLAAPPGTNVRVESATNLSAWVGLVALAGGSATSLQYTDSAAPYLPSRFYRARAADTNTVAGDILPTDDGEVVIRPLSHATFVMQWQGKMIYVDPDNGISYAALPKAELILLTHSHSDHLDGPTLDSVRGPNAVILAPNDVYTKLSAVQKTLTGVLANGQSTNLLGLTVEAVPAYNANHPVGVGNGYVINIGGKRIYIAGDTGDTPEMRALANIDVAFLPMNQPYTLTVTAATNVVTAFKPKVVYPYHYRDQSGTTTSAALFKQRLDPALGVEVRLRKWY